MPIKAFNNSRPIARNTHVVDVAQRSLRAASHIIQQQNQNALQVAGFPILVYQRMTGGQPCSCSVTTSPRSTAAYDEDGHASASLMATLEYQAGFGIETYNPEAPSVRSTSQTVIPSASQDESSELEADADWVEGAAETHLSAFSAGSCNICHGTGFKGGYSFLQGSRTILDHSDLVQADYVEIDRHKAPYAIRCLTTDAVLKFSFPNFLPGVPTVIRIWNNFTRVFPVTGTDSVRLVAPDASLTTGNGPLALAGFYQLDLSTLPEDFTFTHVEILQLTVLKPVMADFPALSKGFDPARLNQYQDASVNLPPSLPKLSPRDILVDLTYGLRWLITSATSLCVPSTGNQQWQQTVECRPLEPHEQGSRLLLPTGNTFAPYGAAQPNTTHSNFNRTFRGGF